ncbi:MAG: type III PLP-dependent enzyme [Alphaproteobacteria bacterium]
MNKVISLSQASVSRAQREGRAARIAGSIDQLVSELRPSLPLYILQPERIIETTRNFVAQFPGSVMYAVKSNPDKTVIQAVARGGVKAFDCASIEEIRLIRKTAPKAKIFFMHPVKGREAIREAYDKHGVRSFSLDTVEELYKIVHETDYAPDLELFVRISTPSNGKSILCWTKKFGAEREEAVELLRKCRPVSSKLGMAFHVGWQCMEPKQYRKAINLSATIIKQAGVNVEMLDVGGGFPSEFMNMSPPDRTLYMQEITRAVKDAKLGHLELFAEPGQGLVANAGTLIARVELRKGNMLYLNDGVFGTLHDAGKEIGIKHPVTAIRAEDEQADDEVIPFQLAGPTCTTEDMMPGPYLLPANIEEGDWVCFSMIGAYAMAFRTNFNGFGACQVVALYDEKKDALSAKN